MKNFNNFGCGADYLNFLIDLHDIEPVFALKEMLNEQDEYDWIDWELYSLYNIKVIPHNTIQNVAFWTM